MRRTLAGALASLTLLLTPVPASAESDTGTPASDSVPDAWTSFVDSFARERNLSFVRAEDQIDAFFRCLDGSCDPQVEQWRRLATLAGWPESDWPWLACIIRIESRGHEHVVYRGTRRRPEWSVGLLQLNTRGRLLDRFGGLGRDELLDPLTNLSEGRKIYVAEGARPWGGRCRR